MSAPPENREDARVTQTLAPGDPRHGTANGYNNLKCRCGRCRAAWAAKWGDYYRRVLATPRPELPHGTESRYIHRGCRCDACKHAARNARWERRHATRASSPLSGEARK